MELCIHIDTNTGFQFDGYVVIPDSDLLDPASYQRFVKFGEVGSLLRNIILQVIDVFLRVQAEIARRANITPDRMLMYGKEASNRKQEVDRQHHTIPKQKPNDRIVESLFPCIF